MLKQPEGATDWQGQPVALGVERGRFVPAARPVVQQNAIVLPGFVDAHCHVLPTGLDLKKLHLGRCQSREEVLEAVAQWRKDRDPAWLHAVHYDQTRFADAVHLTREELDPVTGGTPTILRHVNGHASVANTAALEAAGIHPDEPDPKGGEFVRDAGGRLTGVLLEKAHERVTAAAPAPTQAEMVEAILAAAESMAALGITAATDMMTGRWDLEKELAAYHEAAERGAKVRLRLCVQWGTVLGQRGVGVRGLAELRQRDSEACRVIGLKIFADGAIGSATAAIYGRFLTTGGDGQLIYEPDRLNSMVLQAHEAGLAVAVHSIGDRSTDLVMDAFEATGEPSRHRLEHVMILSDAQIERLARLNCRVTMQPEFLARFGHSYRRQLPPEVAAKLKRARSVKDAGLRLSLSSDRPIVAGEPWVGIGATVDRPEGFDPSENLTLEEAIDGYTRAGAEANDDPGQGRLEAGAFADFQVYHGGLGAENLVATYRAGEKTFER